MLISHCLSRSLLVQRDRQFAKSHHPKSLLGSGLFPHGVFDNPMSPRVFPTNHLQLMADTATPVVRPACVFLFASEEEGEARWSGELCCSLLVSANSFVHDPRTEGEERGKGRLLLSERILRTIELGMGKQKTRNRHFSCSWLTDHPDYHGAHARTRLPSHVRNGLLRAVKDNESIILVAVGRHQRRSVVIMTRRAARGCCCCAQCDGRRAVTIVVVAVVNDDGARGPLRGEPP